MCTRSDDAFVEHHLLERQWMVPLLTKDAMIDRVLPAEAPFDHEG